MGLTVHLGLRQEDFGLPADKEGVVQTVAVVPAAAAAAVAVVKSALFAIMDQVMEVPAAAAADKVEPVVLVGMVEDHPSESIFD
jgi:hypothetical protein